MNTSSEQSFRGYGLLENEQKFDSPNYREIAQFAKYSIIMKCF